MAQKVNFENLESLLSKFSPREILEKYPEELEPDCKEFLLSIEKKFDHALNSSPLQMSPEARKRWINLAQYSHRSWWRKTYFPNWFPVAAMIFLALLLPYKIFSPKDRDQDEPKQTLPPIRSVPNINLGTPYDESVVDALVNRGAFLLRKRGRKNHEEALRSFLQAGDYDPENIRIQRYLHQAYELLGQEENATKAKEKLEMLQDR